MAKTADYIVDPADLDLIFIRAQDAATGEWGSVSIQDATDAQFEAWAKVRANGQTIGHGGTWSRGERAAFCTWVQLHQGPLAMLTREAADELARLASETERDPA